jgi:hypothetical protein
MLYVYTALGAHLSVATGQINSYLSSRRTTILKYLVDHPIDIRKLFHSMKILFSIYCLLLLVPIDGLRMSWKTRNEGMTRLKSRHTLLHASSSPSPSPQPSLWMMMMKSLLIIGSSSLLNPSSLRARPEGVNRPDLLPKDSTTTPLIDTANYLS